MSPLILLSSLLVVALGAVPATAQVIEIDSSGSAQTYDQPTVFTGGGAAPIGIDIRRPAVVVDASRLIAEASAAHGIDRQLLEAVAWQESRGRMAAVSVKGASGVMQLMPATAAELGVRIDDMADNIRGGAIYLRRQLDRFQSVPLALAAYNAGPGAVARFGGIPPYRETQNYVSRIMARWRPATASAPPPIRINPSVIEVPSL